MGSDIKFLNERLRSKAQNDQNIYDFFMFSSKTS